MLTHTLGERVMMSIRWKDPLLTMFPSLWSTSRSVSNAATTKQTISPSTQDSFNHQKHNRQQHQLHCDIEAAADQMLTPVLVQPTSSSQQLPLLSVTGNSNINSRVYQHDGDPFIRRSGVANHQNNMDGNLDSSTSSLTSTNIQQQLVPSATNLNSDTISNNNARSGNFPASDVLLVDNTINVGQPAVPRSTTTVSRGGGGANKILMPEPKLIHPYLLRIPLHIRFALNGFVCNIMFMVAYNYAALMFERTIAVSSIYSIVYFIFIPLGHAFVSLFVFGWPERYIASLMNNFPIGLSAIAIGSALTGYLDSIDFTDTVDEFVRDNFIFFKMPPLLNAEGVTDGEESQFWSSLVVLFVTSLWTYVLSIYVNTTPTKSEKKEL